jgi:hypothetical protein
LSCSSRKRFSGLRSRLLINRRRMRFYGFD